MRSRDKVAVGILLVLLMLCLWVNWVAALIGMGVAVGFALVIWTFIYFGNEQPR